MTLGALYSQKPARLKRHPSLAALSIVAVRGFIVNAGFFSYAIGRFAVPRGPVVFFSVFAAIIAVMKDTPDLKGDSAYNIPSFPLKFGRVAIFRTSELFLGLLLLGTAAVVRLPVALMTIPMLILLAVYTEEAATRDTSAAATFLYQFYWKCFYACYIALFLL
jgi:4-hydroxybenzoate polyprenyltransferase